MTHFTRRRPRGALYVAGAVPVPSTLARMSAFGNDIVRPFLSRPVGLVLVWSLFLAGGCSWTTPPEELKVNYGTDDRTPDSVNSYSVLAGMFAKAGHTVGYRRDLAPSLKNTADVIVYAPDSFEVPKHETIDWLETWLREKTGRTLIYIGRDFDAEPLYWQKVLAGAPAADQPQIKAKLQAAKQRVAEERSLVSGGGQCPWFKLETTQPQREVRTLDGAWMDNSGAPTNIDAKAVEIQLNARLIPEDEEDFDNLLISDNDWIVARKSFNSGIPSGPFSNVEESQLILVANGSFLMNVPLVNREHRKLAGKLIEAVGPPAKHVVFLESYFADPPIRSSSAPPAEHSMLDVFGVWPLSAILLQVTVLFVIFAFSRWPLFGPPRDPPPPPASDFGQHISAVGETLAAAKDSSYAGERWRYYQDNVRGKEIRE